MEVMPLPILIFYSIPESIILLSLGSMLYGYDVKTNLKRIFLLSICTAVTTYIVRALPVPPGINIFIEIPVFVILTMFFLNIALRRSLFIILTAFLIAAIAEGVYNTVLIYILGDYFKIAYKNVWLRLLMSSGMLLFILLPAIVVFKKKIVLSPAERFRNKTPYSTKITLLVIVILAQALLAGLMQVLSLTENYFPFPIASKGVYLQKLIGFSLIAIPIISVVFLKRLFVLSEKEAEATAQEAYMDSINDLYTSVQDQRHDFINHIQVLHGLMQLKKYKDAGVYLDYLVGETREIREVLNVDNLAVTALLRSKQAVSVARKVNLKTDITCSLKDLRIKSYYLVKILGNLLDNAVYAVANLPEENCWVSLRISREDDKVVFEVANPGPVIPPDLLPKVFDQGYTTKKGSHSGYGLYIVKKLAEQNGGTIEVSSDEEKGTVFTVKFSCSHQC